MVNHGTLTPELLLPIDISRFKTTTRDINFDVFIKLSPTNFAHVFSRNTGIDYKRLAQYIQKGIKELYIRKEDEPAYQLFISRTAEVIFQDPTTQPEKKIATLLNMTEQNMSEIFSQFSVDDKTAENSQKLIRKYVDIMLQKPETLTMILKLVSHGEYLYYHSIAVSLFSMFIAKATGQINQKMLELVGMGGFLHDIGCTQLPKEVFCSPYDLTADQWAEMKAHPKLGLKMLETTQAIPDEVRHIIYQHHEQPNGAGYPNGVHAAVIYYPAKIVAIADCFSALISKRPYREPFSVEDSLQIIRKSEGKYDRDLVKTLLSVFKPGYYE